MYDPENQPIVACSQDDWDLVTRIVRSRRLRRLGELCTAFQGEVNETTDGKKGSLLTAVSLLAEEFAKERPATDSSARTRREDLRLICFEYVTA